MTLQPAKSDGCGNIALKDTSRDGRKTSLGAARGGERPPPPPGRGRPAAWRLLQGQGRTRPGWEPKVTFQGTGQDDDRCQLEGRRARATVGGPGSCRTFVTNLNRPTKSLLVVSARATSPSGRDRSKYEHHFKTGSAKRDTIRGSTSIQAADFAASHKQDRPTLGRSRPNTKGCGARTAV
jgi:hypothetical protein